MNISKSSSPIRLIAFFLVAVMLICSFGFSVDGWSFKDTENKTAGAGNIDTNIPSNSPGKDSEEDVPVDKEPEIYIPKYTNYITGLETSEALSETKPVAIVMNTKDAGYSLSCADLLAEFPVEDGSTRFMALITDFSSAGKIGAIAQTRGYISNLASYFGANTVSYGNDDGVYYDSCNVSESHFDLSEHSGYHYSEFTHYQYTNSDLLLAGLKNSNITTKRSEKELPYVFNEFGKSPVSTDKKVQNISIAFSDSSSTELIYTEKDSKYLLCKNGETKKDLLNDESLAFTNCLVLFADSVTYESLDGEQMVMNTVSGGTGYYMTHGTISDFTWSADIDGNMTFLDNAGAKLSVNRGNTYIAFVKSSKMQSVTFK